MDCSKIIMIMKNYYIILILAALFYSIPLFSKENENFNKTLLINGGAAIPLSDHADRLNMYLPYFSLAYRVNPHYEYTKNILLEFDVGFFALRAKKNTARKRAVLFTEPLMVNVFFKINIWKNLDFLPHIGLGMILNQATKSTSSGAYNHIGCNLGIEFSYRFTDRFSIHAKTVALFGFDKNRMLYHIIPVIGFGISF